MTWELSADGQVLADGLVYNVANEHAQLISAAPDLLKLVQRLERRLVPAYSGPDFIVCAVCSAQLPEHRSGCELDAALRKAGAR